MGAEDTFAQLGFNALEAEVYVALLKHGPQTAYKIGKLLNRPTANVYKAVDALLSNGAVEAEEGDTRICRAIPIKSLVQQLQRSYHDKLNEAVAELSKVKPEQSEEGIFKLYTAESVFQRAEEMLKRCRKTAVIDAFPGSLKKIKPLLEPLVKRGVEVFVEAYAPVNVVKGVSVMIPEIGDESLKHWNAQQLNIAVDGKEMLVALFRKDMSDLVQANYSNNLYLSCLMYNGLLNEHLVHAFSRATSMKEIEQLRKKRRYLFNAGVPGLEQLFRLYQGKHD
jgi:sugar-specific transcriptional regulator TrmB